MGVLSELIGCGGVLPASLPANDCFELLKDVKRVIFKSKNGIDPFNTATEATAAAVKAQIETKSVWDAAIALSDIDRVMMTPPKITTFDRPQVGAEIVTEDDQTQIVPQTFPNVPMTFDYTGLSSLEETELTKLISNGLDYLLVLADGKVLYKNISEQEADDDKSIFFRAVSVNFTTRGHGPGANTDKNRLTITHAFDEMAEWVLADSEAFGLTI